MSEEPESYRAARLAARAAKYRAEVAHLRELIEPAHHAEESE